MWWQCCSSHWTSIVLKHGSVNYGSWTKFDLLLIFLTQVLMKPAHIHSFSFVYGFFYATREVCSWNRYYIYSLQNLKYLLSSPLQNTFTNPCSKMPLFSLLNSWDLWNSETKFIHIKYETARLLGYFKAHKIFTIFMNGLFN